MNLDFLREAFTKLNEETFETDKESLDNLDAFMDASEDAVDTEIDVIDEKADNEEELQSSYVGKVICECPICHSYIFKDKVDLVFDEDKGTVNTEDECPYCCEAGSGYTIVGEVKAFEKDEDKKAEEEPEAEESEEEEKVEEEPEAEVEAEVEEKEEVEESLNTPKNLDPDKFTPDDEDNHHQELVEENEALKEEIVILLNDCFGEDGWKDAEYDEDTGCIDVTFCDECINKYNMIEGKLYDIKNQTIVEKKCANCDEVSECNECNESIENGIDVKADDKETPDELKPDKIVPDESSDGQKLVEEVDKVEITREGGDTIEVINDKETDEVTVTAGDVTVKASSEGEPEVDAVAEVPVEVATADDEASTEEPAEEVVADYEGPESNEEVTEVEETEEEAPVEDEAEVEVKDIDLESFDRIGNNYLKAVYENVESYSSTEASLDNDNNKLIVEGVITFKSGKTSPTKFVFEAKDITSGNKTRFVGTNEAIVRPGTRPFTLTGTLDEGKYMVESMTYHYRTKAPSGKSVRVNGTIN